MEPTPSTPRATRAAAAAEARRALTESREQVKQIDATLAKSRRVQSRALPVLKRAGLVR